MATPYVNPNSGAGSASPSSKPRTLLSTITSFFLFLFERITPDPYIFAVALTILTSLLAGVFAPKGTADVILTGWYNGLFNILAFAFQMVLVLVTGYALSNSPPVRGLLDRLAGIATTPKRAVVVVVLTVMVTSFVNWGCGLVVAGLLAREIAKRIKIDFGWLVAAAYSGWIIWASGLSSSIALAQATPGSVLNVVQKMTGKVLTLNETVLAPFNVVPVLVLMIVIPILYCAIQPAETETLAADSARLIAEDQAPAGRADEAPTLARQPGKSVGIKSDRCHCWCGGAFHHLVEVRIQSRHQLCHFSVFHRRAAFALEAYRLRRSDQQCGTRHRTVNPSIPALRRYHGNHDDHRSGGGYLKSFCRIFERSHLTVLELYRFDDHQSVYPERRRTLGGTRPICGTGGCSATYVAGRDCHGSCHGRASRQHDPAILGLAGLSDSRDKPAASDGIYGHEFFRRGNGVWAGAADVGVAGWAPVATGFSIGAVGEFVLLKRIRLTGDNALSEPLLRSDPKDLFLRTLTDNRDVISPSILTAKQTYRQRATARWPPHRQCDGS